MDSLCVGIVQTTLDHRVAWKSGPLMSMPEALKAESEIDKAMHAFDGHAVAPHLILMPELAAPRWLQAKLRNHADHLEAIVVAGVDYLIDKSSNKVTNEAVLILPKKWLGKRTRSPNALRRIRKTYASWEEERALDSVSYGFTKDPTVWLFDGGKAGRFAVAICYDFLDLERLAMYRGHVHHFFVLSYNRDIHSFDHAAAALSRMAFCNVVICNTGFYGGSLAVTPYREPYRRTLYRSEGPSLFSTQVVQLPVASLDHHQQCPKYGEEAEYKSRPPGYEQFPSSFATNKNLTSAKDDLA